MKETARIKKLIEDLYDGQPWLDVTILNTLRPLSAIQVATKISEKWNSIWQIVNHLVQWRFAVLERVKGNRSDSPADNYFWPITDTSENAWKKTLEKLEAYSLIPSLSGFGKYSSHLSILSNGMICRYISPKRIFTTER